MGALSQGFSEVAGSFVTPTFVSFADIKPRAEQKKGCIQAELSEERSIGGGLKEGQCSTYFLHDFPSVGKWCCWCDPVNS